MQFRHLRGDLPTIYSRLVSFMTAHVIHNLPKSDLKKIACLLQTGHWHLPAQPRSPGLAMASPCKLIIFSQDTYRLSLNASLTSVGYGSLIESFGKGSEKVSAH